jgi:hypothetical protein
MMAPFDDLFDNTREHRAGWGFQRTWLPPCFLNCLLSCSFLPSHCASSAYVVLLLLCALSEALGEIRQNGMIEFCRHERSKSGPQTGLDLSRFGVFGEDHERIGIIPLWDDPFSLDVGVSRHKGCRALNTDGRH